jgi:endothelin-converting enzyme
VHDWYAGLSITRDLFSDGVQLFKFSNNRSWAELGKPVDQDEWGMSPQTLNAYFSPQTNQIVFPAAIMQFPIFDADLPAYVSYGGWGSIVGHEMSHGYDMQGRLYDGNGVLTDWWTNATAAEFNKRAQCFVEQYGNFTLTAKDGTVQRGNGELDLGENIADSGGVSIAFGAWKLVDTATPGQKLPGLEKFTNDQLFFIFRTPFFCGNYNIQYLIELMQTDPHPPPAYRTTAPMLNSRQFRQAFNCPVKQPTCELW